MTNSKSRLAHQLWTTIATRILILFGGFIVSVVMARLLGPEGRGIVTAVFVTSTIVITLADLGIRQATAYFLGKKLFPANDIVASVTFIWLITSVLSTIVVGIFYYLQFGDQYGWTIFVIVLASIPVNLAVQYFKGIMQGKERIGNINMSEIVRVSANLLAVILLVWIFDMGVIGAALTQLFMAAFTLLYSMWSNRDFSIRIRYVPQIPMQLIKKGFSFAIALFMLQLNYRVDVVFLSAMSTPFEVGIYSVGTNLAELIWQLPAAIGMVIFSRSANSKTEAEAVNRSVVLMRYLAPLLILGGIAFWILCPFIVNVLYGAEFTSSISVIRYLLPGVLVMVIVKILHADLAGRGYPLYALWVSIAPLFVNIGMNFFMIRLYGAEGAAISSSISYTLAGILFLWVYTRKEGITIRSIFALKLTDVQAVLKRFKKVKSVQG
ncbi:flippase [Paenibacillus nasutitermitis]|uniref:Polysaccharide biosynthesis protein C-terminal domain-containing protein n=1 Tax=Paenibacillus nasutitermitis TaxID=1652958 RepID=A0A916Z5W5_9BACL|nr:flippase [Paenibacillus nasutitermitis]GGD76168.1 hypothetical protein GCM10010911_37750 [Paenibacillus nasutitermitis]